MKIAAGGLIGIVLTVAPALGADTQATRLEAHVAAVNRAARTPKGEQAVVRRLSGELGIPAATLQSEREQTKLGWGEIRIANRIAQETGLSFEQVVREFRGGKGWGEIAREHNLSVGKLLRQRKEARAKGQAPVSPAGAGNAGRDGGPGITSGANAPQGRGHPVFPSGQGWGAAGFHGGGKR